MNIVTLSLLRTELHRTGRQHSTKYHLTIEVP